MASLLFFGFAALFEITGGYAFWVWLRKDWAPWCLIPGTFSLVLFALCLTRTESDYAGRAYAAYGGIYITFSLLWLRAIEGAAPDRWDVFGAGVSVLGALIVLFGPR